MAVAAEALEAGEAGEGAAAESVSRAPIAVQAPRQRSSGGDWARTGQSAYGAVSSPSAAAQTVTKLIWAVALGLIVLEIASQATGKFWSFNLPTTGKPLQPQGYAPLYQGQPAIASTPAAASMPWMPLSVVNSGQPTPGATQGGGALIQP